MADRSEQHPKLDIVSTVLPRRAKAMPPEKNGPRFRFSLKSLFASCTIWLGVILWLSSLVLPAVADEDEELYGIQLLIASILVSLGGSFLLDKSVVVMCIVASALHLLMLVGLMIWIAIGRRGYVVMRCIAILMILGAIVFRIVAPSIFTSMDIGFHAWISSFICVGIGLFGSSFVR